MKPLIVNHETRVFPQMASIMGKTSDVLTDAVEIQRE
jgi:hypothetical protein